MGEAIQDKFRVVVGVNFSEGAKHAVLEAMLLARLMPRVELHYVHVMEVSSELHDARLIDALSDSLGQSMAKLERYVRDTLFVFGRESGWGIDLGYHVRVGPVARELHQVAVDNDAELIVVGERRTGSLRNWFHRSAAEELVRSAHVPIVIAHPKDYKDFPKTQRPDAPRPGQDLSRSTLYDAGSVFEGSRSTHIAGLL
jgi:nucleotide-binding universal stress UspA family protein